MCRYYLLGRAVLGRAVRVVKNNMNNEHARTQCIVHILVKKEHSAMEPGIERLNSINMGLTATAIDSFFQPNRSLFNLQRACTELVSSNAMVTYVKLTKWDIVKTRQTNPGHLNVAPPLRT